MRQVLRATKMLRLRVAYRLRGIEAINEALLRSTSPTRILRTFGATIGGGGAIHGPLVIHNAERDYRNLVIGDRTHVGRNVFLDLTDTITIEDEATLSMGCTILTHQDIGDRPLAATYPGDSGPTRIGSGSYLGANVTVLYECNIGERAMVGAGAVVTDDVESGTLAVGVPARMVKKLGPAARLPVLSEAPPEVLSF